MVTVQWKGGMAFEAVPPSGNSIIMDSHPDFGGTNLGPSPMETLLAAVGACSAMDVVSILKKKQQEFSDYRIEVVGHRAPEGEYPRPYLKIEIKHIVKGKKLDHAAVARSVQLSDEKYCSVVATLRAAPEVTSSFTIEPEA
ncbi:MAG: OsmC family protein [Armatimonadetes bacterium]|nr:OsmC family protein [Armatimonadota bacterium]